MKDLLVVAGCTCEQGFLAEYRRQLEDADIDFLLYRIPQIPNGSCGNIGMKVENMRRVLREHGFCYRKIVFSDAFDVLFYGTKDQVMQAIPDDDVLLAAEKICFPDLYLSSYFEGTTPWRFVNGGVMAGTPENVSRWLDAVEADPGYHPALIDQQFLNLRLLQGSPLTPIDSTTKLFFCMAKEAGELDFDHGRPLNTLCGTAPCFFHFNGHWDATNFLMRHHLSLQIPSTGIKELQNV